MSRCRVQGWLWLTTTKDSTTQVVWTIFGSKWMSAVLPKIPLAVSRKLPNMFFDKSRCKEGHEVGRYYASKVFEELVLTGWYLDWSRHNQTTTTWQTSASYVPSKYWRGNLPCLSLQTEDPTRPNISYANKGLKDSYYGTTVTYW